MNITRVERDGVEFFTIEETGESGMSESGLARLCNVSSVAIHKFVSTNALTWEQEKELNPRFRKTIPFKPGSGRNLNPSQNSNIKILSAFVCAKAIEYYAFDSKHKTEEALFTYRKFAEKGINAWIQDITHWHGNAVPRNGIVLDFDTLDLLLDKRLDGTSHRLFLIIQKAIRSRQQLTPAELMQRGEISRSAYSTAIHKLNDLNLLPTWITITRKNQPEREVRDRLQTQLGGQTEAPTPYGLIDLLTQTELIEIKRIDRWKDAIGHILAKSNSHPTHKKRLHLYGPQDHQLPTIKTVCTPHNIRVTYEKITPPKPTIKPETQKTSLTEPQKT